MLDKSSNYDSILSNPLHYFETQIVANNAVYGHSNIKSLTTSQDLFGDEYSIGSCIMNQFDAVLGNVDVSAFPKFTRVELWTRMCFDGAIIGSAKEDITESVVLFTSQGVHLFYADSCKLINGYLYLVDAIETTADDMPEGKYWGVNNTGYSDSVLCKYYDATSGSITVTIRTSPFRSGTVTANTKVVTANNKTNWLPKGVFYTKKPTYDTESNQLTITGYDEIFRTEQIPFAVGAQVTTFDTPTLRQVAQHVVSGTDFSGKIASNWNGIGLTIDNITDISDSINLTAIPYGYTVREILTDIAVACGGNWTMCFYNTGTDESRVQTAKLRLVKCNNLPTETALLVDELGNRLVFGEDRILV